MTGTRSTGAIAGLVLAGGASQRMGRDKAGVVFAGETLIARAVARLAPQVGQLAVSGDPADAIRAATGLPVLPDPLPGRLGPLAGIAAGLAWAVTAGAERLQVVPVDAPFLPMDLVARLAAVPAGRIAVARSFGRPHPVVALIPVRLGASLAVHLATDGRRSVAAWLDGHDPEPVDFPPDAEGRDPFLNLNTPDDLDEAARRRPG